MNSAPLCQHVKFQRGVLSGGAKAVVAVRVGLATELVRAALCILLTKQGWGKSILVDHT